jgi:hypothetical protein
MLDRSFEEHQLIVRRRRRIFVPAHVHASAQRVRHLRPLARIVQSKKFICRRS